MKTIPLSEAKTRLSHYGRLCHNERVIVIVNGKPAFELVPLDEDDDLVDRLLEQNSKFVEMLRERLKEKRISAKEALRRLG